MHGEAKQQWLKLCEQAAVEEDTEKLVALVKEINRMLDEKEKHLSHQAGPKDKKK